MPLSYPKFKPTDKKDFDRGTCPLKANMENPYCNGKSCAWWVYLGESSNIEGCAITQLVEEFSYWRRR